MVNLLGTVLTKSLWPASLPFGLVLLGYECRPAFDRREWNYHDPLAPFALELKPVATHLGDQLAAFAPCLALR